MTHPDVRVALTPTAARHTYHVLRHVALATLNEQGDATVLALASGEWAIGLDFQGPYAIPVVIFSDSTELSACLGRHTIPCLLPFGHSGPCSYEEIPR